MEAFHTQGVIAIAQLQEYFKHYSEAMIIITGFGDPRSAFVYYFPLVYFCRASSGVKVMWTASIAEWLNSVFKWLLFGHRPYWWLHTSGLFNNTEYHLVQFRATCETGPGSPSGHVMVTAAVWFVMINEFISHGLKSGTSSRMISLLLWLIYTLFLGAIGVSRCFIMAHFPHQIIGGAIAGVLLGMICNRFVKVQEMRFCIYVTFSVLQLLVGALIYGLLWQFQIDAMWSLPLATKWCARADWVHLNTTPFFCYVRDASALLGTGAAVKYLQPHFSGLQTSFGLNLRVLQSVVALVLIHTLESVRLPTDPPWSFYCLAFARCFALPWIVLVVVPGVFSRLQTDKKYKSG